jgi:hypothetical protein
MLLTLHMLFPSGCAAAPGPGLAAPEPGGNLNYLKLKGNV